MSRRTGCFVVALALTASACGGGEEQSITVRSPDGGLTIVVPRDAAPDGFAPTIRELAREEFPPELARADLRGSVYDLGPDGATFTAPVTVTRRIEASRIGADLSRGVPFLFLASRDSTGRWDVLADQQVRVEGSVVVVEGTTTHFSAVLAFGGAVTVRLQPDVLSMRVGASGEARVSIDDPGKVPVQIDIEPPRVTVADPSIATVKARGFQRQDSQVLEASCLAPGRTTYTARVELEEFVELLHFTTFFKSPIEAATARVLLDGVVECTMAPSKPVESTPSEELPPAAIAAACAVADHTGFGRFPSSIEWRFQFTDVPPGATVSLTVEDANEGKPAAGTVDTQGRSDVRTGIFDFGSHDVQRLILRPPGVDPINLTQAAKAALGEVEVTEASGTIAGTCP